MTKRLFYFLVFLAVPYGLFLFTTKYFGFPDSQFFVPILVGLIFYFYYQKPSVWIGLTTNADIGAIIILSCLLLIDLGTLVVIPSMEQEKAFETCGTQTREGQCYRLPKAVCQNMWEKYEIECKKNAKEDAGNSASALLGPVVKFCTQKKFDKSLYFTRKSGGSCAAYFQTLK